MEHEEDTKSTSSQKTFHPFKFALAAIITVIFITTIIHFLVRPSNINIILWKPSAEINIATLKKAPWKTVHVKPGDNLIKIFNRLGVSTKTYNELIQLPKTKQCFKNLKPKQPLYFLFNKNNEVEKIICLPDHKTFLKISKEKGKFKEETIQRKLTEEEIIATGTVKNSFNNAAAQAHLPLQITLKFADIFSRDINFSKDIHKGDQFKIIYSGYFSNGKEVKVGNILAAEFTNKTNTYDAIRFQTSKTDISYFTPTGKNYRRAFMRAPIKYVYISSPFNARRLHPILHIVRPHEGVDLAANTGTPIHASSEGVIKFRGRMGGYGNLIIMQDGPIYSTRYAHMSHFSSHFHVGSHVKMGQVIGYVGQTGMATGPHLHYEFRINGIPHDPMKVKLPNGAPVPHKEKSQFIKLASQYVKELSAISVKN